jgi:hypothetical protein
MHSVATHSKRRVNDQRNGRPLGLFELSFTSEWQFFDFFTIVWFILERM